MGPKHEEVVKRNRKRCPRCKKVRPIVFFARDRSRPDGISGTCKICKRQYDAERRE